MPTPGELRCQTGNALGTLGHTSERREADLTDVAAPPMTDTASTSVSDAIDQFQAQNQELALVLEGGETVGLVTATDAFECITGELEGPAGP